jgi:hypothetical protein
VLSARSLQARDPLQRSCRVSLRLMAARASKRWAAVPCVAMRRKREPGRLLDPAQVEEEQTMLRQSARQHPRHHLGCKRKTPPGLRPSGGCRGVRARRVSPVPVPAGNTLTISHVHRVVRELTARPINEKGKTAMGEWRRSTIDSSTDPLAPEVIAAFEAARKGWVVVTRILSSALTQT